MVVKLNEGLSSNDTKHNWFLCSDEYETVEVLPEDKCNDLVMATVYDNCVEEGIIDEDDETYLDNNKFYRDFKSNIIEAKYGVTKRREGLKTPYDDYIIIKDSDYVGKLPCGYYVDEEGDLLDRRENVVGHVQNEPNVGYLNEAHNITEVYTLHGYLDFQIDPSISKDFFVVYIYNKKIEGDPTPQLNKYSNSKLYFTDYQEGEDSFGYPQRACVVYVLNYPAARDYPSTEVALPDVKEVCNKVLGKNKYSLWDGDWGHERWYNR